MIKVSLILTSIFLFFGCTDDNSSQASQFPEETMYFPPIDNDTWETKSLNQLNWNNNNVNELVSYLSEKNTKSFIILQNGRIVMEYYFNGHSASSPWYWASAGKTLTTAVTGIAQQEGYININNKVSEYIGSGWTSAPLAKENLITCKHLLSMTSGLDDSNDGITPVDLQYLADAGTRWAYHSVFFKLQNVVSTSTSTTWDNYFNIKLKNKIGMSGGWFPTGSENVYWSNTRSMARFGLLILNNGNWNGEQIINQTYMNESTTTSQDINLAYGYMWWLNGKTSFHIPQSQFEFQGKFIPNAPDDMYCGLGKDDQKLYIIPSKKLVIVRMGNAANETGPALTAFDNELWQKINAVIN